MRQVRSPDRSQHRGLGLRLGFREHPEGFHIDRYEVVEDWWAEGFDSISGQAGIGTLDVVVNVTLCKGVT